MVDSYARVLTERERERERETTKDATNSCIETRVLW